VENQFNELIRQLTDYDVAVDEAYLHGLLTGYATIPEMNAEGLFPAIAGGQPLAESVIATVFECINLLAAELSTHAFRARFDINRDADTKHWLDGYFKAVEIHERDWQELNDSQPEAGAKLIMLHTMHDSELHDDLEMDLPGPGDLKEYPQLVTNLVVSIYDKFHGAESDDYWLSDDESSAWLDIPDDELSAMDESELMAVVTSNDDILPLKVITECVSRKDAMVPLLREHLENDAHWCDDVDESDWWGLLHAVMILGLIPGEASAKSLLDAFRRITFGEDSNLSDWLSSCWPALCRDKKAFTTVQLRQVAENPDVRWYARCQAIDCVLAAAAERGTAALDGAIDWLAAMCGDAAEDLDFRVIAGHSLLDFPRERHRRIMEALVDLQEPQSFIANAYTRDDIQYSLDAGDRPEWRRFDNPWQFYDPVEIARRQERWLSEARDLESGSYGPIERGMRQPYLREQTKIGRNEPCPCGSGKKYKKCCMNTRH
jgi:Uncharacterised protein family (UPF0149)/SEC-C motif